MTSTSEQRSDGVVRIHSRGLTPLRASGVLAGLVVLVLGALLYYRVGWDRTEVACSEGPASAVELGWSLPDGFGCRFSDGSRRSSLLWMSSSAAP